MQKMAAKPGERTIWNRMREGIGWDSKEYEEANQKMRDTDDHVRAIVTAQKNGNFDPINSKSLKDILKSARTNFNRKEYAKCIGDLSVFHKSMVDIFNVLNNFDDYSLKQHRAFLLSSISPNSPHYDPEYAKYVHDLRERMSKVSPTKKAYYSSNLVKDAGISDLMSRFTDRGRELAAWEKKYPKIVKELKRKTNIMLDNSDKTLSNVFSALKEMSHYRSIRQVDDWYDSAKKIISYANSYHQNFIDYYNSDIKQLLGSQEFISATKSETERSVQLPIESLKPEEPKSKDVSTTSGVASNLPGPEPDISLPPTKETSTPVTSPSVPPLAVEPVTIGLPTTSKPPSKPIQVREQSRAKTTVKRKGSKSYENFIESLQVLSNEHPIILAKYILKYANSIKESDLETYDKLINIIKSIKA